MTQSNGKSQLSTRWNADIKATINEYNFKLEGTFDSILTSNARHKCEFCGQPLRYVANIIGHLLNTSNSQVLGRVGGKRVLPNNQFYKIGLDCLGLVLGTSWAGYNEAQRQIKVLKTEAAIRARKEKYSERYSKMILWLKDVVELTNNSFLSGMLRILTTGSTVFSPKMEDAVKKCARNKDKFDVTKLRKHSIRVQDILANIQGLIEMIKEGDVISEGDTNNTLIFVESVYKWVNEKNYITEKQSAGLKKVRSRYVVRREKWAGLKREYKKRCEIPW